jgi:hypothetical protein
MRRPLIFGVTLAAGICCAVTPAWANATGNFHLKGGGAVGCHWATFGGVGPLWASSGFIHCERYSDHTFVEITRKGRLIVKKNSKGWVAPGPRASFPFLMSRHLACATWVQEVNGTQEHALGCSFSASNGGRSRSFTIGETGPVIIKRS